MMTIFKKYSYEERPEDQKHVIVKYLDEYVPCVYQNGSFYITDVYSYGERDRINDLLHEIEWCYFSDFVKTLLTNKKE